MQQEEEKDIPVITNPAVFNEKDLDKLLEKMRKRRLKPPLGPEDGAGPHLSTRRKWCFTSAVPPSSGIRLRGWAGLSGSGLSLIRSRPVSTGM